MLNHRLWTGLMIALLCLAAGLVFAQDATTAPASQQMECEAETCPALPFVLAATEGEAIWFGGALDTIKASAAQTNGFASIVEVLFPPGGGTPLHVHHDGDEALYILEGTMIGVMGGEQFRAEAGSFVWHPRGIPHGFMAEGDETMRILVVALPGGFDGLVRDSGEPAQELTLPPADLEFDLARLTEVAGQYGTEILGPLVLEP